MTLFFFAHPIDERLERIGSDDIEILYMTLFVILMVGCLKWYMTILVMSFSLNLIFFGCRAAFSDPLTDMYDHPVQEIDLTTSEAFAIHEFIVNGGKILLDFDGKSSYSDNYSFFTNTDFLKNNYLI